MKRLPPGPAAAGLSLLGASAAGRLLLAVGRAETAPSIGEAIDDLRVVLAGAWQDALLALALAALLAAAAVAAAALDRRRGGAGWTGLTAALARSIAAALVAYTAINLPVALVLGGPLSAPMLAGAGGALGDSVRRYLDVAKLLGVAAVLAAAWGLGRRLGSAKRWIHPWPILLGSACAVAALSGLARQPLPGYPAPRAEPNAVFALARSSLRLADADDPGDLGDAGSGSNGSGAPGRTTARRPFAAPQLAPEGEAVDLRFLRGRAAGRHVIWVVLESTPAGALPLYGATLDPMPHLARLAERGIAFDWAYTGMPESVKGVYSLLCSRHVPAYRSAADLSAAERPCDPLPKRLAAAGYWSGLFHSGRFAYLGMRHIIDGRGYDQLVDAAVVPSRFASSFGVDDAATVAAILRQLDERGGSGPFFIHYLPIAGHHPYESPGEGPRPFGEQGERHRHLSDLAMGDAALGHLVAGIQARGWMDDSLWILSGDHGQAFLEHPGNIAHSLYLYEENLRVPLILVAPGLTDQPDRPRRAPQIAGLIDVAPPLLDLLGLPPPPDWQGRSLLEPRPGLARFRTDHQTWLEGLRQGPWKFILDRDNGRTQLFDLRADPGERHDLSAREPDRVLRYRRHLEATGD